MGCEYQRKKPCDVSFLQGATACFALCARCSSGTGANLRGSFMCLHAEARSLFGLSPRLPWQWIYLDQWFELQGLLTYP